MRRFAFHALLLLGCHSDAPTTSTPTASPSASAAPSATSSATAVTSAARVRVESPFPGGVEIVNDSDAPVRIQWDLPIERESGGAWSRANAMTMMQKCVEMAPADKCVTIAPHSKLAPLPWTGWFGCTQCGICRANAPAGAGRYRVVALECEGGARHEGPAMTIVDEGRFAKTPHVYAPSDEPAAIVVDNESDEPASFRLQVDVAKLDAARGAWETIDKSGMLLSPDCFPDAGACVTVPAHGTLRSQAFRPGCARCAKCATSTVKPGTYMSTVQLCDGAKPMYNAVYGTTWRTAPFVVDAHGAVKPESH